MATVLSTLYPPLIDTFMPAFPNTQMAEAHFTVSPYNSSYDISYLHITLVDQRTNKNAFATDANVETPSGTALINGVWIIPFNDYLEGNINPYLELNRDANNYTLYIPPTLLKQNDINERTFVVNSYYKLQLRFDKNNDPNISLNNINSDYLSTKRAYFSEWSSVCLLKAIPEITVHFNNFTPELDDYLKQTNISITNLPSDFVVPVRVPQYIPGLIPFAGNLTFAGFDDAGLNKSAGTEYYHRDIKTTSNSEYLMSYRITVTNQNNVIVRDSGIQYPSKTEKTNNFYWLCDMTITNSDKIEEELEENTDDIKISLNDDYIVTLTFTTNNQYTFSKSFDFKLVESQVKNFSPFFQFLNKRELPYYGKGHVTTNNEQEAEGQKVLVTSEDGKIQLRITNKTSNLDTGYLFIKRASALDNFQNWQLIDCYFNESTKDLDRTITDNTLSSLTEYKYACQYLTLKGNWSPNIVCGESVYPDFHDILISRGNRQLAIRYNAQITSMTPVVSRIKIDTLGGRYPKFAENAKLHYKQFQLNGLITAESDFNRQFLSELDYSKEMETYDTHMNGKYMVRNDTVRENTPVYPDSANITNHDLYPSDNWWWERKFREEAIEWLNDGEPKLYRSMTEGNLIVMIDGVSLTPNSQLGRRTWNFSATLYEVGNGNSLDQLDAFGIYDVVNVYNENLTKVLDGDSGISTPYEEHRYVGQIFGISANDAEQTTTKMVNITKANDKHGLIPIDNREIETGLSERAWVETLTLGEQIQFLYEGLNRDFDSFSVKLKDVKIQFESLPQWYDLDALTPEGTNPYAVGLTISVFNNKTKEWEEKIGRIYLDENGVLKWEPEIEYNEPLWAKSGVSITDFINDWETACGNSYELIDTGENGQTSYIGSLAAQTYYYKANAKINEKEYIKKDEIMNHLYRYENNSFKEINPLTNDNNSISNIYYGINKNEKDPNEVELNNHYFLEKDLLDSTIYKQFNEDSQNEIIIYDNMGSSKNNFLNNYYTRLASNNSMYYKDEKNYFYLIKNNFVNEYYQQSENHEFIEKTNLVLYRKAGGDCIIKNNFNNNTTTLSSIEDFESLDDLFNYTLLLSIPKNENGEYSIENQINELKIFDEYYNSRIDVIQQTINLSDSITLQNLLDLIENNVSNNIVLDNYINTLNDSASTINELKAQLKALSDALKDKDKNVYDSNIDTDINDFLTDNSIEETEMAEQIQAFINSAQSSYASNNTKHINIISQNKDNNYWIMSNDNSNNLYKNIKWTKHIIYNNNDSNNIKIENEINSEKYNNINIINKDLTQIFDCWKVISYSYGENQNEIIDDNIELDSWLKDNIGLIINANIYSITVIPSFKFKSSIEQKLIFKKEDDFSGSLNISLKRGESIHIYNLPQGIKCSIKNENSGTKSIDRAELIDFSLSKGHKRNTSSPKILKGTITTAQANIKIVDNTYILQEKDNNNEYIDKARVINNKSNIIFYNVIADNNKRYRIKRLEDNKIVNLVNVDTPFSFDIFNSNSESKNAIDFTKDYILNTELLDKKNIEYYELTTESIQIQDASGSWIWKDHPIFSLVEDISNKTLKDLYIKYKSIYLKIDNIYDYPYFLYDEENNSFSEINGKITYYKYGNQYIEIPNIETNCYIRIFTRDNINKATQQNDEEIEPYYIALTNWEKKDDWIEYNYYDYQLDPHMSSNCYNLNNNWWVIEDINKNNLYENINNENSKIPTFILTTDTREIANKKYYYQTIKSWDGYPQYDYYPLGGDHGYFEKLSSEETSYDNNKLGVLKKYVYVANIGKYLPASNIKKDSKTFGPGNELIKVKLNTGADLSFSGETNESGQAWTDNIVRALQYDVEKGIKKSRKNYGLGYKLRLILTSPYDQTVNLERTIFVNERGYYQVPSNMIVKDIGLFDGAKATIDYILEYEVKYNDVSEPNAYEVAENIVGQVSGEWDYSTQIAPIIAAKYFAYDKEDGGHTMTQQSVDYWRATSYDGTPYTILRMKSTAQTNSNNFIVSRSGVLNLETDYPTEAITILGKRMVQAPKDRQKFLDEWEFVLDDSVFDIPSEEEDTGMIHWWIVYPLTTGEDLEDWEESDVLIKINLSGQWIDENLNIDTTEEAWKLISENWYTIRENPEINIKTEIIHPEYNTIYKILNNGKTEYKIYYLNQGWYPVEFPNKDKEGNIDYTICNAKVPINGMINYRASILKKLWINE